MPMNWTSVLLCVLLACLAGCEGKLPESDAAKKVGAAPKQAMDRTVDGARDALDKGADRNSKSD